MKRARVTQETAFRHHERAMRSPEGPGNVRAKYTRSGWQATGFALRQRAGAHPPPPGNDPRAPALDRHTFQ